MVFILFFPVSSTPIIYFCMYKVWGRKERRREERTENGKGERWEEKEEGSWEEQSYKGVYAYL